MGEINVRRLGTGEQAPMELLLDADPSRQAVEDYLRRGDTFVATRDNEVIGVLVLLRTRPLTVELVNIAVIEKQRGQGVGKRLVEHAIQTAKTMGAYLLEVGTGNSSLDQLGFYQRCGFRITGVERNFFIKHYPEAIMENGIRCVDMIRLGLELG